MKITTLIVLLLLSASAAAGPRFFIKCYTVPAVLGGEICFKFEDEILQPTKTSKKNK